MFKIGQKIVCVKVNPLGTLKDGEIYTVTSVRQGTGGVKLKEAVATDTNRSGYFACFRFREVETKWVEELLSKIAVEVKDEEYVNCI